MHCCVGRLNCLKQPVSECVVAITFPALSCCWPACLSCSVRSAVCWVCCCCVARRSCRSRSRGPHLQRRRAP
jgi:hypothetical protein